MQKRFSALARVADVALAPFVYPAALLLKGLRRAGIHRMPLSRSVLRQVGVFPVRDHYFEPLVDARPLQGSLGQDRSLPGIDWNVREQLEVLDGFDYNDGLKDIPASPPADLAFYLDNGSFETGDAEYLFNTIRARKPARLVEIGSGNSTLMAIRAIRENERETPGYRCDHVCIEPYEMPWLEKTGVRVLRERVEEIDRQVFLDLEENDLLFIDSSHVIRPRGDVLVEYLEILPLLRKGVVVHVHDIFTPRDYPEAWIVDEVRLWNEQYLLEAFLTSNRDWKVIGALNYLHHHHFDRLQAKCPYLTRDREPGSFYMQKVA